MSIKEIEKKVRKEVRLKKLIKKHDTIIILDKKDSSTQTIMDILTNIVKDPTITIKKVKKLPILSEQKKLISPNCMEKEAEEYIKEFVEDKEREESNIIKPLIRVKQEECDYYCKKKKIVYKNEKEEEDPTKTFVHNMQKKYAQTLNSIIRTQEQIKSK